MIRYIIFLALLVNYFAYPSTGLAGALVSGHSSRDRAAAARAAARVAVRAAVLRAEARPVAARAAARLAVVIRCRRVEVRR